jgi:hypothetical protein
MNPRHVLVATPSSTQSPRLWNDSRVWWVNCIALEAAWSHEAAPFELPQLRQRRDAILNAFIEAW